jgi:hypothetical protein
MRWAASADFLLINSITEDKMMRIMELAENVTPEERLARMNQLLDEMLDLTDALEDGE